MYFLLRIQIFKITFTWKHVALIPVNVRKVQSRCMDLYGTNIDRYLKDPFHGIFITHLVQRSVIKITSLGIMSHTFIFIYLFCVYIYIYESKSGLLYFNFICMYDFVLNLARPLSGLYHG